MENYKFLTTENVRKENHFVIYTMEDEAILYIENAKELERIYKRPLKKIVCKFNKNRSDVINIVINEKFYKLYTFTD